MRYLKWGGDGAPSTLRARIGRIRDVPFLDALGRLSAALGFEPPDRPDRKVRCVLPGHDERTPSCGFSERGWYCHGCKRGGGAVELVSEVEGLELPEAVARAESILGLASDERGLAALARRAEVERLASWAAEVDSLAADVSRRARPYMLSPDPVARGVAHERLGWVLDELRDWSLVASVITPRGRRETLRSLRLWAIGLLRGVERDVLRATGRDRLDVVLSSPLSGEAGLLRPQERAVGLGLLRFVKAREAPRTRTRKIRSAKKS